MLTRNPIQHELQLLALVHPIGHVPQLLTLIHPIEHEPHSAAPPARLRSGNRVSHGGHGGSGAAPPTPRIRKRVSKFAVTARLGIALSAGLGASACDSSTCWDSNQPPCVSGSSVEAGSDATVADGGATGDGANGDAAPEASDDGTASSDMGSGLDAADAADAFDSFDGFDGFDGFVCDPMKEPSLPDACPLTDTSGVFVAPSGHDGAAGTMADPLLKIGDAIKMAAAGAKRVLACGGTYNEQVTIDASADTNADGLALYGGLDCIHGWKWKAGTPTVLAPTTPGIVVTLKGLSAGVIIEDFGFHALPGANAGDSSIAVFASKFSSPASSVLLRRCDIAAGKGKDGQDPVKLGDFGMRAPPGNPGSADGGAPPSPNTCNGVAGASVGGGGGAPFDNGKDGMDGTPLGASNKGTAGSDCSLGIGKLGANGAGGVTGAGASVWATLDETGWKPAAGQAGGNGGDGQGGGGGASENLNAGGGGGGAGGCGGAGGAGGTGGGSSIGVLAYQSGIDLQQCTITAADAGRGGNGAQGQSGQAYGYPGNGGGGGACQGGQGGYGGSGGGGGGGAGGLSAGVVWFGVAPTLDGMSLGSVTLGKFGDGGAFGPGGTGGSPGARGSDGKVGMAASTKQFQ